GQDGDFVSLLDEVAAKSFNERALANTGNTRDAHPPAAARARQQLLQDFLRARLMLRRQALHQSDRPRQRAPVSRQNPCHVGVGFHFPSRRLRNCARTSLAASGMNVPGPNTAAAPWLIRKSWSSAGITQPMTTMKSSRPTFFNSSTSCTSSV